MKNEKQLRVGIALLDAKMQIGIDAKSVAEIISENSNNLRQYEQQSLSVVISPDTNLTSYRLIVLTTYRPLFPKRSALVT